MATGIAAIVERAANERQPVIVEGVHVLPGALEPGLRERCVAVEALVAVEDAELHRGHFSHRPGDRPRSATWRRSRTSGSLQAHLWSAPASPACR